MPCSCAWLMPTPHRPRSPGPCKTCLVFHLLYHFFFFYLEQDLKIFFLSRVSGSLPDTVTVEDNRLTVKKVDSAVNTTFVCEVKNKHGTSSNQITIFIIGESVFPVGSHAVTQTSTVYSLEWHHTQKHTHVKCWDLVRSEGCKGEGSSLSLHLRLVFIFPFLAGHLLAGISRAGLTYPVPQSRANTAELSPHCQPGNCNSDFQSNANIYLQI